MVPARTQHGATCAPGDATGGQSALYARLAELHQGLAETFAELARTASNQLDGNAHSSPGVDVQTTSNPPRARDQFVTVRGLAERLQVDQKTIRRWRDEQRLPPALSVGGIIRWSTEAIDAWLQEQERSR